MLLPYYQEGQTIKLIYQYTFLCDNDLCLLMEIITTELAVIVKLSVFGQTVLIHHNFDRMTVMTVAVFGIMSILN